MGDPVSEALTLSTEEVEAAWSELASWVDARFGREATVESILFLIGIQAEGIGYSPKLAKERKQDLIMRGTYEALAMLDVYERVPAEAGSDTNFRRTAVPVPDLDVDGQEKLLKIGILNYFRKQRPGDS